jgi:hypothetical protein
LEPACLALLGILAGAHALGGPPPPAESLAGWKLVRTLPLRGKTYHVQGVDTDSRHIWVTSCDRDGHKAWLHQFSLASGTLERAVDLTDGERYHPGGIDTDASSIWVPIAEYRPNSTAVIERLNKRTLEVEIRFAVPDHIGCIAVTPENLLGGNWDSNQFYVWDHRGSLLRTVANPSRNNYQDMKFVPPFLVASGLFPGRPEGAVDWLEWPGLTLSRRLPAGANGVGVPYTREGMSFRGGRLLFVPEDGPSRLFIFEHPR